VRLPAAERRVVERDGLDAARASAGERLGLRFVGDDGRHPGPEPPGVDGVEDRLQIAAAARGEDDEAGRWTLRAAHKSCTPSCPASTRPITMPCSPWWARTSRTRSTCRG